MAKTKNAFDNFVNVINSETNRNSMLYSQWIQANFTHPKNNLKPWSWDDHEFQIEIFDQGPDVRSVATIKPAQVGLSEGQIRWALTFCATNDFLKVAYVLPTASFSASFAATRIGPAISNSPLIKSLVSADTDNVKFKKVGSCFLFMLGTSGERAGISVDLDALIVDEKNFCDGNVLQIMNSRLIHSKLKLYRSFSTPTLTNFGISSDYDNGSQAVRLCKCDHCGSNEELTMDSIEIPGFTHSIKDFDVSDAKHPGVKESYIRCLVCKKELSVANLNDPTKRQWVHKYANRYQEGNRSYKVTPWDVPSINLVPEVLADIAKYGKERWTQFRMGEAFDSADNSFLQSSIAAHARHWEFGWTLDDVWKGRYRFSTTAYVGVDLGKNHNYVTIGVENDRGGMDVVGAYVVTQEMIRAKCSGDVNFGKYLSLLCKQLRLGRLVTDHSPNYEVALYLANHGDGKCFGAYYKNNGNTSNIDIYKFNEDKSTVSIQVNENFSELCGMVNNGAVRLMEETYGEFNVMYRHLSVMKKQQIENSKGQTVYDWVAVKLNGAETTEDHFAHSLGYCYSAFASSERRDTGVFNLPDMGWLVGTSSNGKAISDIGFDGITDPKAKEDIAAMLSGSGFGGFSNWGKSNTGSFL